VRPHGQETLRAAARVGQSVVRLIEHQRLHAARRGSGLLREVQQGLGRGTVAPCRLINLTGDGESPLRACRAQQLAQLTSRSLPERRCVSKGFNWTADEGM